MKKKRLPKWAAVILLVILIPIFISFVSGVVNSITKLILGRYATAVIVGELLIYLGISWLAVEGIMYLWNNYI